MTCLTISRVSIYHQVMSPHKNRGAQKPLAFYLLTSKNAYCACSAGERVQMCGFH
jgi:hypothetical protein